MSPSWSAKFGITLLSGLMTAAVAAMAIVLYAWLGLPDVSTLVDTPLQAPLRIYSAEHQLIAEYGQKQRIPVKLSAIPQPMIDAFLATEDQRFYLHHGIDLIGLGRAIHQLILTGKKRQGASTITMQVARNFYLSSKKTYTRKLKEILLALKIDHQLSKQQILTLYLNKIYLGQRAYGVAAAARNYYGKTLSQLTLAEMAMIAGLPKAPSRNNPVRRPENAIKRRNFVLKRLLLTQKISSQDFDLATKAPITASKHQFHVKLHAPYVAEAVRKQLFASYGAMLYQLGFNVTTTIHANQQRIAQHVLQAGLEAYDHRHAYRFPTLNLLKKNQSNIADWPKFLAALPHTSHAKPGAVLRNTHGQLTIVLRNHHVIALNQPGLQWLPKHASPKEIDHFQDQLHVGDVIYLDKTVTGTWKLSQIPKVQGALLSINPDTGAITSLVGGYHHHLSHFNRAIQAHRQPGSSIKPFIFSSALKSGLTLATQINDAPVVAYDVKQHKIWRPHNNSRKFYGLTALRDALVHSSNLVTIRLVKLLGLRHVRHDLHRFGFMMQKLPQNLSLALGTGLVSPMRLTGSYAVFANGGFVVHPHLIAHIADQNGRTIFSDQQEFPPPYQHAKLNKVRVIGPGNAFLIADALRSVIERGTGRYAKRLKRHYLAGKTGTTNELRDAWFVGFSRQQVTTVWLGFDDNSSLQEYAARAALPIWTEFMGKTLAGMPDQPFVQPKNIVPVRINSNSGLRTREHTTHSRFEFFRQGHVPDFEPHQQPPNPPTAADASSEQQLTDEDLF